MCVDCSAKSNFLDGLDVPPLSSARVAGDSNPHKTIAQEAAERHPCHECNGTGRFQGIRRHQEKTECFACKGKGWFKTSFADRMKKKQQVAARKASALEEKQAAYMEQVPGLIEGLREIASWHQFAATMLEAFNKWGSLTERQTAAAQASLAKVAAKRAEKAAAKAAKSGDIGVEAIAKLFATAQANGLKRPRFITERLEISLAPAHGRNAGAIYVKADHAYAGKIVNGQFMAVREAPADIMDLLRAIAADPMGAATAYGKATGVCACCGRELTDPKSIEVGIGPVCAEKWF